MKSTVTYKSGKTAETNKPAAKRKQKPSLQAFFLCSTLCILILLFTLLSCEKTVFHENTKTVIITPSYYISPKEGQLWVCEYADSLGSLTEIPITNVFDAIVIEYPVNTVFPIRFRLSSLVSVSARCNNSEHFGMILPFSDEMDLHDSAAADIFFTVLISSNNSPEQSMLYCSCFNWEKLLITLRKYDDPYELDLNAASADIAQGRFTSKSLKKPLP